MIKRKFGVHSSRAMRIGTLIKPYSLRKGEWYALFELTGFGSLSWDAYTKDYRVGAMTAGHKTKTIMSLIKKGLAKAVEYNAAGFPTEISPTKKEL